MVVLPDTQLVQRSGMINLASGHPAPELLPAGGLARAAALALGRDGQKALSYGAEQGPGHLIERLRGWLGRHEGATPPPERVLITGGVSQALDLLCTLLTRPGDVVLVAAPTYHLALRIFRDHGLELLPVESDSAGVRVDALEAVLGALGRAGRRAKFLYLVPTFGNPTGVTLPLSRRRALVKLAYASGLTIIEDDVYRELWFDSPPPSTLYELAPDGVVNLGSFSKLLAPGLRLGWMLAAPQMVERCVRSGQLDSGGGLNHFTAHVVAAFMELGLLDEHVEMLRRTYRERRDALSDALAHDLPAGCGFERPGGGYFVWVQLPEGWDSVELLPAAESAGVTYVPGVRFYVDGKGKRHLRLAFSLLPPDDLTEGVRRLARVLRAYAWRGDPAGLA